MLRFEGTQADGTIPRDGTLVDQLDPILGPDVLGNVGNPPYLQPDGRTIVFDGGLLGPDDQLYLENTNLLRQFTVQLVDTDDATNFESFRVVAAAYDDGSGELTLSVDPNGPGLDEFLAGGPIEASLVPHWFRMVTLGVADSYPQDTVVTVFFEGTGTDPLTGGPDEVNTSGEVTVIDDLNLQNWDFVRFRVEFNLDEDGNGVDLSTPRPALDHLRFSFTF
jgi:hypothetical protein